jgi:hypothetical protein
MIPTKRVTELGESKPVLKESILTLGEWASALKESKPTLKESILTLREWTSVLGESKPVLKESISALGEWTRELITFEESQLGQPLYISMRW